MIVILIKTICFDKGPFYMTTPTVDVMIVRLICSLFMHMELIHEINQSLDLLHYLNAHPEEFSKPGTAFLCGFLQLTGGIAAEFLNCFMISVRYQVDMIITFFVAFHVLAVIDKIYLEAMCDLELIEAIEHPLVYKRAP